jgi:hypothetical protein
MEKRFTMGAHLLIKAVRKAGLTFPITKAEAIRRAGDLTVRVDFEKYVPLADLFAACVPEEFENVSAFYNALLSAQAKAVAVEKGYY